MKKKITDYNRSTKKLQQKTSAGYHTSAKTTHNLKSQIGPQTEQCVITQISFWTVCLAGALCPVSWLVVLCPVSHKELYRDSSSHTGVKVVDRKCLIGMQWQNSFWAWNHSSLGCILVRMGMYLWRGEIGGGGWPLATYWKHFSHQLLGAEGSIFCSEMLWDKTEEKKKHVRLLIEKSTAVACVNNMGTSHSSFCNKVTFSVWQ